MNRLFSTIIAALLLLSLVTPVSALTPAPLSATENTENVETTTVSIPMTPKDVILQGRDKGGQLSAEVNVDLSEVPPTAQMVAVSMTYTQTGISSGIMRILDRRSISIIDSSALGQAGEKSTTRVDSLIQDWVKNPGNNLGFIFQTSELEASAEIKLTGFTLNLEYSVPDKINPEILKLELSVINQTTARIVWETDEPVVVMAEFGKTSNYDRKTEKSTEYKTEDVLLIEGLSPDLTYHLRFVATDTSGNISRSQNTIFTTNDRSSSSTIPTSNGLLPPRLLNSELRSTPNGYVVDLAWSQTTSENIMGYIVFRNLKDGPYSELARLDKSVTRYSDSKVEAGATYNYYVVSYSGTEQSSRSPVETVTIPNSGVLGLDSILLEGNQGLAIFFIFAGLLILFGIFYFFRKRIQANIAYNEKLSRHQRLHNYLHDPDYYINGYEDAVIEQRE